VVVIVMAWSPVRRVNAGLIRVEAPGDYATPNSNQLPDGTPRDDAGDYFTAGSSIYFAIRAG